MASASITRRSNDGAMIVACAWLVVACGSDAREITPPTPAPAVVAATTPPAPGPDLGSCALSVHVQPIGQGGHVSAPIAVAGGFVVVYERGRAGRVPGALVSQRLRTDGTLEAPSILRDRSGNGWGIVFGHDGGAYTIASERGASAEVIPVWPAGVPAGAIALHAVPDQAARGPRGTVLSWNDGERRVVQWESGRTLELPPQSSWPTPHETLLASGPETDVLVARSARGASFVALGADPPQPIPLFTESDEPESATTTASGVSVAAGPHAFAVVRTGPGYGDLAVRFADERGALAPASVSIPGPRGGREVRRYPRAAALGTGWAITAWDGVGPSLVRVDAHGEVTGAAIELRSGDERGGHTDAPLAVADGAIAATWHVTHPMHGVGADELTRPTGARIALLRCAE